MFEGNLEKQRDIIYEIANRVTRESQIYIYIYIILLKGKGVEGSGSSHSENI